MDGGSKLQTTSQQSPSWQQPYQQYGLNQSLSQFQNTPQLVAPFSPQQESAISNVTNMAANGNPAVNAAQNYVTNTLGGNVQQNPMLNQLFSQGADAIQNRLSSQFGSAGRNVGASEGANNRDLSTFAANLYGNAFGQELGAQQGALNAAPGIQQSQLGMQDALYGAGSNVQGLSNQYIQAPQLALNQYLSRVNGNLGATQTSSPAFNAGAGALGGALTGSNIGSQIGNWFGGSGGDWGSILGAIGGGLLGG